LHNGTDAVVRRTFVDLTLDLMTEHEREPLQLVTKITCCDHHLFRWRTTSAVFQLQWDVSLSMTSGGHMVAVMALMEAPAIIVGVILIDLYEADPTRQRTSLGPIIRHSFTNGSVMMILGSLLIGLIADEKAAIGIKPFTTDIFKGFLALFLLEMGLVTGAKLTSFRSYGWFATAFGIVIPLVNGCAVAALSGLVTADPANRFMFAILAASASYIAVPAAMRLAAPKADPGLYIPMALGVTFPFNITVGMPVFLMVVRNT
jgi:hypothetical protein